MSRLFIGAVALTVFASPALAREECGYPSIAVEDNDTQLARVLVAKARFIDETDRSMKAFVVKGDELLVGGTDGGFVCATFINSRGVSTSGWLKQDDVALRVSDVPPIKAWFGDWTAGEYQNLTIKRGSKKGWLAVSGEAYWAANDEAARNGGIHEGGVGGEAPLESGMIGFTQTEDGSYQPYSETAGDDYKCAIRLRLVGTAYLAAEDSRSCGGANVSFWGYYARGKVEFDP